jgi:hypothetical protein
MTTIEIRDLLKKAGFQFSFRALQDDLSSMDSNYGPIRLERDRDSVPHRWRLAPSLFKIKYRGR